MNWESDPGLVILAGLLLLATVGLLYVVVTGVQAALRRKSDLELWMDYKKAHPEDDQTNRSSTTTVTTRVSKKGFTLIELVVLIIIAVIVFCVATFFVWLSSDKKVVPAVPVEIVAQQEPIQQPQRTVVDHVERDLVPPACATCADVKAEIARLEKLVARQASIITNFQASAARDELSENPEFVCINDDWVRRGVVDWVVKYNLDILPGDVEWLADRIRLGDWGDFETSTQAVGHHFHRQLEEFP